MFWILFIQLGLIAQTVHVISGLDWPEIKVPEGVPRVCFHAAEGALPDGEHRVECQYAIVGQHPARVGYMSRLDPECCFVGSPDPGVFWGIGETVMTPVMHVFNEFGPDAAVQKNDNSGQTNDAEKTQSRVVKVPVTFSRAELLDVQVIDSAGDMVISGAGVTISDTTVHLVSMHKKTDGDGYAVFPVIPGKDYAVSVRANGYLPLLSEHVRMIPGKSDELTVDLDSGVSLDGVVIGPDDRPVAGAEIHVEVDRPDQGFWSLDIDGGGTRTTDKKGQFSLLTIPRGQIKVYAVHPAYVPSRQTTLDASDNDEFPSQTLRLEKGHRALIRVENAENTAVSAAVSCFDEATGIEVAAFQTGSSGASELTNLPEKTRFSILAEGYVPFAESRKIADNDEIVISLEREQNGAISLKLVDRDRSPVENASVNLAEESLRKKHARCTGTSDADGRVSLTSCPESFWIEVSHSDFARRVAFLNSLKPLDVLELSSGQPIKIEIRDQLTHALIPDVSCSVKTTFSEENKRFVFSESYAAPQGILDLLHRPQMMHEIECRGLSGQRQSMKIEPSDRTEILEFAHVESRNCVVLDALGAPVPYARIETGSESIETDESGQAEIVAQPGARLEVYQWHHGHASHVFETGLGELELRLPDEPDSSVVSCINRLNLPYIVDGASVYLDAADAQNGILRGDIVESCSGRNLVIVRDVYRMRIKLK